jgi:hypothetical protein
VYVWLLSFVIASDLSSRNGLTKLGLLNSRPEVIKLSIFAGVLEDGVKLGWPGGFKA